MAEFRDFDAYVLPYVAGAPRPAIDDALVQAAIRFCKTTYAINETIAAKVPAKPSLAVESTNPDLEVHAVLEVYGPNGKLDVATKRDLVIRYPDGWQEQTVDIPEDLWAWLSLGENTIRLVPYLTVATTDKVLTIEVSMRPKKTATTLPDLLLTRWPDEIAFGALALLHSHVNVPYANATLVEGYGAAFSSGISKAADEVEAGFNRAQLRTGLDEFP
jgi:hypothetical protein